MAKRKTRTVKKKGFLKDSVRHEVIGIAALGLAVLGIVTIYSGSNGLIGGKIEEGLTILAGSGRVWLMLMLGAWGIAYMNRKHIDNQWRTLGVVLLWLTLEGILHFQLPGVEAYKKEHFIAEGMMGHGGGLIGAGIAIVLKASVGISGGYVVLIVTALIGALLITNRSLIHGLQLVQKASKDSGHWVKGHVEDFIYVMQDTEESPVDATYEEPEKKELRKNLKKKETKTSVNHLKVLEPELVERPVIIRTLQDLTDHGAEGEKSLSDRPVTQMTSPLEGKKLSQAREGEGGTGIIPPGKVTGTPVSRMAQREGSDFQLPNLTLLNKSMKVKNPRINKDLADNVKILEDTLESFGVKIKVTHVTQGPAITRYEAQPAPGVKVSKITNLSDDIALSLAATDVRIEAPVPGKSVVGIEVPNKEIATVHFREVLETPEFQNAPSKLTVVLGKDITGSPIVADLTKMPHLLIAGATGSGKSVCVNTLINSILYKARPDEVKFLLVDPKMVELTNYNGIPHLIAPVVTDPKKAAGALKWIVTEMETRYELFAAAGVRDIVRYNFLRTQEKKEDALPLPYVVVIIDELADLMMVAPGDVEDSICRLAQMARAAGIHLLIATQRPSVDVITGLIKANIPSRIAFAVSSQIDSRTILDMNGAEKLLGRGDMLYYPMGASKPVRVQGCYLADKEVENVVRFLQNQAKPEYQEIPHMELGTSKPAEEAGDELFRQAAILFIEAGNASVSLLQRRLRIGYTRAARLMDLLEEKGVVGGYEGSKPREVLLTKGQFEQKFGLEEEEIG
ncbi:DNA segregation ATPase, FtsK/SpoIIIE family [Desulfitobacterium dichloroeliminans LMG P-21439]|uniref:DNA segregation ATPase, FtsK/SpoIIIE family n=1 Tax=Desulfitobacterium dichloroeliminans (strain LMG P-21439 / DCA1) TaxID=871963 RepID=L0FAF5_DESDL|nr:DNA translocase FtsK [Desulfitobacterium dichloroeliminans]AGA69631.1 DNA segregation ATPase, FtsK/SpoIIIE family [Desulfitobacterium dichloroeliminans LMG P-21439]